MGGSHASSASVEVTAWLMETERFPSWCEPAQLKVMLCVWPPCMKSRALLAYAQRRHEAVALLQNCSSIAAMKWSFRIRRG